MTQEESEREVYPYFQPNLASSTGCAKGYLDHWFHTSFNFTIATSNSVSTQSQQPVEDTANQV